MLYAVSKICFFNFAGMLRHEIPKDRVYRF